MPLLIKTKALLRPIGAKEGPQRTLKRKSKAKAYSMLLRDTTREGACCILCCLPHGFFLRVVFLKKKGQQEDFNRVKSKIKDTTLKKTREGSSILLFGLVSLLRKTRDT